VLPRRDETDVRFATAGNEELLAGGRALHVPAKAISEVVRPD
jgi:hypothetical protein